MAVAVERIRAADRERHADLRPRRLRRRRHLRDGARRPLPARARRRRRLAPAEPLRGGLRRLAARRSTRLADEGVGLVLTVDCGITAVEEVAEAQTARARGRRHRPPPAGRRAARLPDRRDAPVELSVPRALRHRRRLQARRGAARCRPPGGSRATSTSSRSRRSPTSSRSSTRTARSRSRACAPSPRRRVPGCRRSCAVRGVDPAAVDAGAVGFRLAPRINAAGRLGRPDVALELVLTDDADEARRIADDARGAEPRSAGGRGSDPARGDRGRRRDARADDGAGAATCSGARTGTRA